MTSLGAPLGMTPQSTMSSRPFLSSRPYFAAPSAGHQSQFRSMSTRVQAAKDKLKMYGFGSSPLANFALTAIDATNRRDVSVKAKAKETTLVGWGWSLVDDDVK